MCKFLDNVCLSLTENIDNSKIKTSFTWPNTIFHQTASIQCPCPAWPQFTKGLHAFKVCGEHGSWERTILDNCIFSNDVDNLCLGVSYPIMKMSRYYISYLLSALYVQNYPDVLGSLSDIILSTSEPGDLAVIVNIFNYFSQKSDIVNTPVVSLGHC